MKNHIKGCLVFLGIIIIIIGAVIGWFYYGMVTSSERQNEDDENCKNIEFITDNPSIVIENIKESYNTDINLFLIDDNDTIEKKVIRNNAYNRIEFNIPFNNFKKRNKILIITNNGNYLITEMEYFNDGHWGMFGYLGNGGNCEFSYNCELIKK